MSEAAAGRVFVLPAFETLPRLGLDRGVRVAERAAAGESDFGSGSESDLDECLSHLIGSSLDRPPHRLTMISHPYCPPSPSCALGTKGGLTKLLESNEVITFAAQLYRKGHECTNFNKW